MILGGLVSATAESPVSDAAMREVTYALENCWQWPEPVVAVTGTVREVSSSHLLAMPGGLPRRTIQRCPGR